MTHSIDFTSPSEDAGGGRLLRALFTALRVRAERARRDAAGRRTRRILESLDPDQLRDIGLRPGELHRALRGDPGA